MNNQLSKKEGHERIKRVMIAKILHVFHYFGYFNYAPTLKEIHTFLQVRATMKQLVLELKKLIKDKIAIRGGGKYTLGEYSIRIKNLKFKIKNARKKLQQVQRYIKFLSLFPQIRLIGLSGSVAMTNANNDDDIDLFIITGRARLWTGRLIAVVLAYICGLKRQRQVRKAKDKVCLNLFFDENQMEVPVFKRNEYVAHEVLQMKPLVSKGDIYKRYLDANSWVYDIFPNAKKILDSKNQISNRSIKNQIIFIKKIGDVIEFIVKRLQLISIHRHKTTEFITEMQLWFFPDDFERKISTDLKADFR